MNKAKHEELISQINDSMVVTSGNIQLALKVERPKWVDRYLIEIQKQTKIMESLLNQTTDLCQSECYSGAITSGNSSFTLITHIGKVAGRIF